MTTNILIADADFDLTEVYRDHLAERGFSVRTATHGLDCVVQLRRFRPDLVVLGTSLLWGGCEGVLAAMDEEYDLRPEVVILLARTRQRGLVRRAISYGVDGILWQPLAAARLVPYVETLLLERAGRQLVA